VVSESPYIRLVKDRGPEPDVAYVHDLVVLRAMDEIFWEGLAPTQRPSREQATSACVR
jgi:hypothetical protein